MVFDPSKFGAVPVKTFNPSAFGATLVDTKQATKQNLAQINQAKSLSVPESQQTKVARLQLETLQAQNASKKAGSVMEKWVKPVADTFLPGVYSLGETYQGGINSAVQTKGTVEDTSKLYDSNIQIIKKMREMKKTGKDTSNLQQQYNQNVDLINYLNQNLQTDTEGANKSNKQVAGEIGMTGLNILTAGTLSKAKGISTAPSVVSKIANVIQQPSKLFSLKTAGEVAKGSLLGEAFDVTGNLQQDYSGSDILTKGYGKYIGGAIPLASKGLGKLGELTPKQAKNKFINNINEIFHNSPKSVSNVVDKAENQVHLAQFADEQGVNLGKEIADRGFMPTVQNERMTFGAKPFATLDAEIAQDSRLVDEVVKQYPNTKISVEDAKKLVSSQIEQSPTIFRAGKVSTLTNKANNVIDELAAQSGKDYFTLPELQNFKKGMWAESKKFEHKVSGQADAYSEIGSAFRKIIEEEVPDVAIYAINQRIGRAQNLYTVLDKINSLQGGGLVLKGGKVGKYVGDITGTVIGGGLGAGMGGPVGAGIGALVGKNTSSLLRNLSQKSSILGPLDRILIKFAEKQGESSAILEARAFLESVKNGKKPSITPRVQKVFDTAIEEARKIELLDSMRLDKNYYNNLLDQGVNKTPFSSGELTTQELADKMRRAKDLVKVPERFSTLGTAQEKATNTLLDKMQRAKTITNETQAQMDARHRMENLLNIDNKNTQATARTDAMLKSETKSPVVAKIDPLIQEAKKYKSAEEFVKAQTIYRGQPENFKFRRAVADVDASDNILIGKGVFNTSEPAMAGTYGKNILEFKKPTEKILDISNASLDDLRKLGVDKNTIKVYQDTLKDISPATIFGQTVEFDGKTYKVFRKVNIKGETMYELQPTKYGERIINKSIDEIEKIVKPKQNLSNVKDAEDILMNDIIERFTGGKSVEELLVGGSSEAGKLKTAKEQASKWLNKQGYNFVKHQGGIRAGGGKELHDVYIALSDEALKPQTKSQLTDIWNKANKK